MILAKSSEGHFPIAVGKVLTTGIPAEQKGRAVQITHHLYDHLWNYGPKTIPKEYQNCQSNLQQDDSSLQEGEQNQEEEKEAKENENLEEEKIDPS